MKTYKGNVWVSYDMGREVLVAGSGHANHVVCQVPFNNATKEQVIELRNEFKTKGWLTGRITVDFRNGEEVGVLFDEGDAGWTVVDAYDEDIAKEFEEEWLSDLDANV